LNPILVAGSIVIAGASVFNFLHEDQRMPNLQSRSPIARGERTVDLQSLDALANAMREYANEHRFSFRRGAMPQFKYAMTLTLKRDDAWIFLGTDTAMINDAVLRGRDANQWTEPMKITFNVYAGDVRAPVANEVDGIVGDVTRVVERFAPVTVDQ
jgi:hypothetical protein